ncbi:packaged DNA stabilization gp4 family protein [Massilia varians]|uniref:packaged DNA stabilization gp4 family protein n=1 Tax=Massilia varians TaxID=457921 RepID=UPI0025576A06|nr:packaged DNA stabilization gp4 family protein [Massilia varians]MDK6077936.1 packaged DNA stabilization gp4 family protein [Massilia varians]
MAWTKKQLIEAAFEELALAGFVFDLDADQLEAALRKLDTMMAAWSGAGISIGYLLPAAPDASNIDDDAGIPDTAVEAVYMNLAVKLAAGRGKTLTVETRTAAQRGYNALLGAAVAPAPGQCSGLAATGAGNKPWRGW